MACELRRVALGLVLPAIFAMGCNERSSSNGSSKGSGGVSCGSMCRNFQRGDNCEGLDTDACVADCEALSSERTFCDAEAAALVKCLSSASFVCTGPGEAVVEASGAATDDPAYLYASIGTLTVEDANCSVKAHAFNDCVDGKLDLSQGYTFEAEGPDLEHDAGEEVSDGWLCNPDLCWYDYIIYGPYVQPAPGSYRAIFRIKAECDPQASEATVSLDEPTSGAYQDVFCTDLSSTYQDIVLDFDYTGGEIETRAQYNTSGTVTVDHVRIEPR